MDYVSKHGNFLVFWILHLKLLVATGNSSLWLPSRCCWYLTYDPAVYYINEPFQNFKSNIFDEIPAVFINTCLSLFFSEDNKIERVIR